MKHHRFQDETSTSSLISWFYLNYWDKTFSQETTTILQANSIWNFGRLTNLSLTIHNGNCVSAIASFSVRQTSWQRSEGSSVTEGNNNTESRNYVTFGSRDGGARHTEIYERFLTNSFIKQHFHLSNCSIEYLYIKNFLLILSLFVQHQKKRGTKCTGQRNSCWFTSVNA